MSMFEVKKNIDRHLYKIYNLYSDMSFVFNVDLRRKISSNHRYKNRHLGSRAFIVGTGPSVNSIPKECFKLINSGIVFSVNSCFKSERLRCLELDYYVLVDNHYWGLCASAFLEARSVYGNGFRFITDYRARAVNGVGSEDILVRARNYPVDKVRFNLDGNFSISLNVIGTAIMAAMYMGCSEIYLLGCDFNSFCCPGSMHCYDDEEEKVTLKQYNLAFYLDQYARTAEIHYLIDKTAKANGIRIINATADSLLDAYRKIDIETLMNK